MSIRRIQIVLGVTEDRLLPLKLGGVLAGLVERLRGHFSIVNAPDDAPQEIPRNVIQFEKSILNVALNRIELFTGIPDHICDDSASAFEYSLSKANLVYEPIVPKVDYQWLGVIVEMEFKKSMDTYKSHLEAITPVADKLLTIHRGNKRLANFDVTYALYEDNYYIGYRINGYELREGFIFPPGEVALDKLPVSSLGVEVKIDTNNKRVVSRKLPIEDLRDLFELQKNVIRDLDKRLNLEGILQ